MGLRSPSARPGGSGLELAQGRPSWISRRSSTKQTWQRSCVTIRVDRIAASSATRTPASGLRRSRSAWHWVGLAAIRSPERAADATTGDGVLDADAILPAWTEARRQALLRRALFDPATYGRIRFHHRSVQEYLAACRLRRLRDRGMSSRALVQAVVRRGAWRRGRATLDARHRGVARAVGALACLEY